MADRFLAGVYPFLLWGLLLAWAAAAAAAAPQARKLLGPVLGRRGFLALAAVALLAFLGRWAAGFGHRVFFDELEHLNAAASLASGRGWTQTLARLPGLDVGTPPTWPGLFHAALAPVLLVFGPGSQTAFVFAAASGALACAAAGAAAALLFSDALAALAAAALLAALPEHFVYSTNADLTAFSSLWLALSLAAAELHARARKKETLLLAVLTLACAAHARFENLLLAPVCLWSLRRAASRRELLAAAGALAACAAPLALLVLRNRALALPGFDGSGSVLAHLSANVPADLGYLFGSAAAWLALIPALAAAAYDPGEDAARLKRLAAVSALYLLVYASFFRGDFSKGTEDRYAVSVLLPLVLVAGRGLGRLPLPARGRAAAAAALLCLLIGGSWPRYRPALEPAHAAELDVLAAAAELPAQAVVVAFSAPAVAARTARDVVAASLLLEDPAFWLARLEGRPVFALKDFWWARRPAEAARLEGLLSRGRRPMQERAVSGYALAPFEPR